MPRELVSPFKANDFFFPLKKNAERVGSLTGAIGYTTHQGQYQWRLRKLRQTW